MSKLLDCLKSIMELGDPRQEAEKKLIGTYVGINGRLLLVESFVWPSSIIGKWADKNESFAGSVNSLELFLPEAGVYPLKDGRAVLITKIPKRQWSKSFSFDFYKYKFLTNPGEYKGWLGDLYLNQDQRVDIFVSKGKRIYYWDNLVGYIKTKGENHTIICEDLNFKQELIDWSKTYGFKEIHAS